MKKILYFIVAHDNPQQVYRLAQTIRQLSPNSFIVIHYDAKKKPDLSAFKSINDLFFIPDPVSVSWGDFSQVEMFLRSFVWINEHIIFDWLVLISGQCYPVNRLDNFENTLTSSQYDAFFHYFKASDPGQWPIGTSKKRYFYSYTNFPHFPYYYKLPTVLKTLNRGLIKLINKYLPFSIIIGKGERLNRIGYRRWSTPFSDDFICYGGWDWFNLNQKTVRYIIEYVYDNPKLLMFYKRTHIPSESFVHTIVVNNPELKVKNDACRYVNWGTQPHPTSPEIIQNNNFAEVTGSGHPFARKFDDRVDGEILGRIDRFLGIA